MTASARRCRGILGWLFGHRWRRIGRYWRGDSLCYFKTYACRRCSATKEKRDA